MFELIMMSEIKQSLFQNLIMAIHLYKIRHQESSDNFLFFKNDFGIYL